MSNPDRDKIISLIIPIEVFTGFVGFFVSSTLAMRLFLYGSL